MFMITKILITNYGQSSVTIANDLGTSEMTVRLSVDEANEVENLVREILATQLRQPIIEAKKQDAFSLAVAGNTLYPAEQKTDRPGIVPETIETAEGTVAYYTPDGYKPDEPDDDFNARARGFKPEDKL